MGDKKSILTTNPWVITGLAVMIGATAGLLVALISAGVFSPAHSPNETATPTAQESPRLPAPDSDHDLSAEELDLLDGWDVASMTDTTAQVRMGLLYFEGRGVPQDDERAVTSWQMAAEQGHVGGQFNLGTMYKHGRGVPRDYDRAISLYRRAAAHGHAGAQAGLGGMYMNGYGVPRDYEQAFVWNRRAAGQWHAGGEFNLGSMNFHGMGVPQDDAQALFWWRRAAERGLAAAQSSLGLMYLEARGVLRDRVEAYKWFDLAASAGHEKAEEQRNMLASSLTTDQIAEAERRSREWLSKQ